METLGGTPVTAPGAGQMEKASEQDLYTWGSQVDTGLPDRGLAPLGKSETSRTRGVSQEDRGGVLGLERLAGAHVWKALGAMWRSVAFLLKSTRSPDLVCRAGEDVVLCRG